MPRALKSLDKIYQYIATNLSEPGIAEKQADRLDAGILSLCSMPSRCAMRRVGAYANKGYRQLLVDNYTIVFRIDEKNKEVIVVSVRYSRSKF